MAVHGFLSKQDGTYRLTDVAAAFLDRRSPAYFADAIFFMTADAQTRGFASLTEAVKRGGSVVTDGGSFEPDSPMWVEFARNMTGLMTPAAMAIAGSLDLPADKPFKVLDIAAGHGLFGITIAKQFPQAEIYAVDWPNVLTVATENAEKAGVADRHHLLPGNALEVDLGTGYDVILLTNFLHHFNVKDCETILRKLHAALNDDGRVITLEFVPNDDRISPPGEALFSLVMLAATPEGDAYTFTELKSMAENAGFSRNQHIPLPPSPQHLIVSRK
jgi:ubiquinone/menaquinone biosynthesis C-methylase UbiE